MSASGRLGAFSGLVTPNVNMLDIFKENEIAGNPDSPLKLSERMIVRKIGIATTQDTNVVINGSEIPIYAGKFELGLDVVKISALVFTESINAQIYYIY